MKVNGADHDMLLLSHIFKWYNLMASSHTAFVTAQDEWANENPLDAIELADLLVEGGMQALLFSSKHRNTRDCARLFSEMGAVVLLYAGQEDSSVEFCWRLLGDPADGGLALLSLCEKTHAERPWATLDSFGEYGVLILSICPAYRGSWERLLPR